MRYCSEKVDSSPGVESNGNVAERWRFTRHARERMKEMGIERREVLATLVTPETTYRGGLGHPPDRAVALRGRLAVVYQVSTRKVVTILWRGEEGRMV